MTVKSVHLHGDSVFDNEKYVGDRENSVRRHLH